MRNELRLGKTIGAAAALSAALMFTHNAHAMSELEELMGGEPVEALSDNELDELRGGFSWQGMEFRFGFDAETRVSTAVLDNVQQRIDNTIPQSINRQEEYDSEPVISNEVIEQSIDGAPVVTSSSIINLAEGGTAEVATPTDAGIVPSTAVLNDDNLSFASGQGVPDPVEVIDTAVPQIADAIDPSPAPSQPAGQPVTSGQGNPAPASTPSFVFDGSADPVDQVTQAIVDINNANIVMNRTINVDITGFSMFDANAARARVESQITNIVNSQVLFNLGQQF